MALVFFTVNGVVSLPTDLTVKLNSAVFLWPPFQGTGLLAFLEEILNCNYQGVLNGFVTEKCVLFQEGSDIFDFFFPIFNYQL